MHSHPGGRHHQSGLWRTGAQDALRDGGQDPVSFPGQRLGPRSIPTAGPQVRMSCRMRSEYLTFFMGPSAEDRPMNPSEEARQSVTQEDIDYAVGLVKQGALPAEVRDKLMEKSLSEDVASTVAHNCVRRSYSEAAELLDMGLTAEQAVHALRD